MTEAQMELYNKEIKERYLDTIDNEGTRLTYYYILLQASITERIQRKDLYNFSREEIADVIKNKQPYRVILARTQASTIKKYIDWAIMNGYRDNVLNPLDDVDNDWYESLVDKERKTMFTDDEIDEIISKCVNPQDQLIIKLLFEGVWGGKLSELSNLHYHNDINWEAKELTLRDDSKDEPRVISVSDDVLELIEAAYNQKIYYFENGNSKSKRADHVTKELRDTGYVFKNIDSARTQSKEKVSSYTFYQRLETIKEDLDLELFNPNSIRKSGQLKMAYDLFMQNGQIGDDEIEAIGERFGLNKINNNGYMTYNKAAMKDIIGGDVLMKYYGVDPEDLS